MENDSSTFSWFDDSFFFGFIVFGLSREIEKRKNLKTKRKINRRCNWIFNAYKSLESCYLLVNVCIPWRHHHHATLTHQLNNKFNQHVFIAEINIMCLLWMDRRVDRDPAEEQEEEKKNGKKSDWYTKTGICTLFTK